MEPLINPVPAEQEDLTVTLSGDPAPEKERKRIEYGVKYPAQLLRDPEMTTTKINPETGEGGKPMLVFTFVLTGEGFKGKTFVDRAVVTTEWKIAAMAKALGREVKDRKVSFKGTVGTPVELVFKDNGRGYPDILFVNPAKKEAANTASTTVPLIA